MPLWQIYLCVIAVCSTATLVLFGIDKHRSKKEGKIRIPEIVLLTLTGFGGSIGALIGMYGMRHKTFFKRKFYFALTVWLAAMLQFTVAILFLVQEGGLLP